MDTIDKDMQAQLEKIAGKGIPGGGILAPLVSLPRSALLAYLSLFAGLGMAGGAGLGALSSYIKTKNPKLIALSRKKDFYDKKIREIDNENWLNEVMSAKKKLETSKLSDEERSALEDKYMKLINQ